MKIAMPYLNEEIFQHFGKSECVVMYEIVENKVSSKNIIKLEGNGHGRLSKYLKNENVDVLICGRMGMHAKEVMDACGIKVLAGVTGNCDKALQDYLQNRLIVDASAIHACCH